MTQITIDEVKKNLPMFLHRLEAGETFVLTKAGKPVAELKPIVSDFTGSLRPFGLCAGEFIVPDDFDAPLPENVLAEFEG